MTAASQAPEHDTGTGTSGPGRLLRSARESAGMSLRDVSAQMHLDERTLVALESDDFESLPAPTFVRGYLRGYARLLGVPVGPVMEAYDREGFNPPELVADIAEKPQANAGDFPMRLMTLAVVVVLAGLVAAWWNNQGFDELPLESATAGATAEPALPLPEPLQPAAGTTTSEPVADATPPASGTEPEPAPDQRSETAETVQPTPEAAAADSAAATSGSGEPQTSPAPSETPAVESAASEVAQSAAAEAEAAIAGAEDALARARDDLAAGGNPVPEETSSSAQPEAAAPDDRQAAEGPQPAAGAGSGEGRLRIRFAEESWVEIYDRDDERLFFNLAKPGQELDLSGEPPIRVLLGRTRGVVLEYNGQPVDLAPFTERGVARITLEP